MNSFPSHHCSHPLLRREFFGRSAQGIGTAALAHMLARDSAGSTRDATSLPQPGLSTLPHFGAKAKRIIYLFQNGAPTHVDLFDYKPELQKRHGQAVPEEVVAGK